jgi:polyisoprenoid-binding protein YceI
MMLRRVISALSVVSLAGVAVVLMATGESRVEPASAAATRAAANSFKIDSVHSSVVYRIRHLGVSNFYGRFGNKSGTFTLDPASPETASINVTIEAESVDSGNPNRDKHLKSPDFFNAVQFPTITFKSTSVKKTGEHTFEVTGDLTLLGQAKPVTAKLEYFGEKDTGPKFGHRAGFEATFTIKRTDFGMSFMTEGGALGNEVTVIAAMEGTKE